MCLAQLGQRSTLAKCCQATASGTSTVILSCLSWKWRKRSSVKITERTYEEGTEAFHRRRKSSHPEAASCGQSAQVHLAGFSSCPNKLSEEFRFIHRIL